MSVSATVAASSPATYTVSTPPLHIGSERLHERLAERGNPDVRPPHGNVFQYLYAIAREFVREVEGEWTERPGEEKMRQLRELLRELNEAL